MMKLNVIGLFLAVLLQSCGGAPSVATGIVEGKLGTCPDKPNCVSSFNTDPEHFIKPIAVKENTIREAYDLMEKILKAQTRASVLVKTENYLHVVYVSAVFRFEDDVELFFDEKNMKIHLRSASRRGHSDFGVNRKRLESLRFKYMQNEI